MFTKKKYALHPGYVRSKSDGDIHYINSSSLIRLYEVDPKECIIWNSIADITLNADAYYHLYPDYDGRYIIPDKVRMSIIAK